MNDKTFCYSYFSICSAGEIQENIGFVAYENSDFDPDYITNKLGIEPFEIRRMGAPRPQGHGVYPFSNWACYKEFQPATNAETQCQNIVHKLHNQIPLLQEIKQEYNVDYTITVVLHIHGAESPVLAFDSEIIEFCQRTKTKIAVDTYINGE